MSHVTTGDLEIDPGQLDDVEHAVALHGGHLMRDQKTFKWYGQWLDDWQSDRAASNQGLDPKTFGTCDHAIHFDGIDYEIGLYMMPNGKYKPVYDNYSDGRKFEQMFGVGLGGLKKEIGAQVTLRMMARKGFRAHRVVDEKTGDVLVKCREGLMVTCSVCAGQGNICEMCREPDGSCTCAEGPEVVQCDECDGAGVVEEEG